MLALINYILKGRRQSIIAALILSILPFLSWLGVAIMGLVTLRKGAKEGFILVLWIMLPSIALAIALHSPLAFLYNVLLGIGVVWLLAVILRQTSSWLAVINTSVVIAVIFVSVCHLVIPNIAALWLEKFHQQWGLVKQFTEISDAAAQSTIQWMAMIGTGLQGVTMIATNLLNLIVARWMQALKYNPSGLRKELYRIRLNKLTVFIALIVGVMGLLGLPVAVDMLPIICIPFIITALSLLHYFASNSDYGWFWLLIAYSALIVLSPIMLGLFVGVAALDSLFNFRSRIGQEV